MILYALLMKILTLKSGLDLIRNAFTLQLNSRTAPVILAVFLDVNRSRENARTGLCMHVLLLVVAVIET